MSQLDTLSKWRILSALEIYFISILFLEKRSMYVDARDVEADGETMESWDEIKLQEVVDKKHSAEKTNSTTIICKYFLEAGVKSLYGWF